MADYEHLKILNQGVDAWNRWREDNSDIVPDLRCADLSDLELDSINFSFSLLNKTILAGTHLDDAEISYADLSEADLSGSHLEKACLTGSNFYRADLTAACLIDAKAHNASFRETCLLSSYLIGADFSGSDLTRASLDCVQAIDAIFCRAVFTGACISGWNPYNADLEGVECDYIFNYSENPDGFEYFTDRLPHDPNVFFSSGEFAARFSVCQETVDVFFSEAINWPAFYQSFLDLKNKFPDEFIQVQGIRNLGNSYVISFEVSEDSNKAAIETQTKQLYETSLRMLEAQHERHLISKEKTISDCKETQASLLQICQTMAEKHSYIQNFHGPVGNVAGTNYGSMAVYINQNSDDISRLLTALRETAQQFPEKQKEDALMELDDLTSDLKAPEKQEPKRMGKRLQRLIAAGTAAATIAGGVTTFSGNANEFTGNVLELAEKIGLSPQDIRGNQDNP